MEPTITITTLGWQGWLSIALVVLDVIVKATLAETWRQMLLRVV